MSEGAVRVTRHGNWKRHICEWLGHQNIGTRDLLRGTPETLCLRCRTSATFLPAPAPTEPTERTAP